MILWELASCKLPFSDAPNEATVGTWISQGEKEEIPKDCPNELAAIINDCWQVSPEKRPTAAAIVKRIENAMPQKIDYAFFKANSANSSKQSSNTETPQNDQQNLLGLS